ncbi:hypothetical protein LMG31886_21920 [Xanthomonas hydrangeae]|nr:hypothetical protein LMG31886_21920 [Xanthomonas hydrangeae]CAD7735085.1 hypothetical protein LMG31886_21920 [Xanthomonas hydrangeae]CAD7744711.1 hypothetical protein LMG31885_38310 [Xanthomonas hydrangeae]CAD7744714.1 hypothetical protein LMG31885_38310 [Xanthomonas hydrangeae]
MECSSIGRTRGVTGLLLIGLIAGCTTYTPLPLASHEAVAPSTLSELRAATGSPHALTLADLQRLVLANNPDLLIARSRRQLAHAQARQAFTLPNPTLSGGIGYLLAGSGTSTAWSADLSQDARALITLSANRDAAQADAASVDATLLWEEWQLLAKVRLLFVGIVQGQRIERLQQDALMLMEMRADRLKRALVAGDVEKSTVAPYLAAALDGHGRLNDQRVQLLKQRHELAALLGASADIALPLDDAVLVPDFNLAVAQRTMENLQQRRPDLLALQLGYQSAEAHLRAEVLSQFPLLTIGYNATQDNGSVRNAGPTLSLELPLFNHNQANIALATATRRQLHDTYAVRLDASQREVQALLSEYALGQTQFVDAQRSLDAGAAGDSGLEEAFHSHAVDLRTYVDLRADRLMRAATVEILRQRLLEQQIAIDALLGTGMPTILALKAQSP